MEKRNTYEEALDALDVVEIGDATEITMGAGGNRLDSNCNSNGNERPPCFD